MNQMRQSFETPRKLVEKPRLLSLPIRRWLTVENLGQVDEDGCTVLSLSMSVMILFRGAPMTSSETRLHSGEGTVGFEMVEMAFRTMNNGHLNKAINSSNLSLSLSVAGNWVSHFLCIILQS